ncbi:MAG: hypothetical protein A3I59_06205 [Planctomycetes bacterium RIFCSPLOWO2_02_FULL_50_16]|nr:MAG: hypothetical protein A3E75_06075 [Planctomycetes bacterium RIFCSPHIGHO2_12_FULL_51_37]OHB94741.1 MAG: hypothetical protein A3I59_06205 [Planctomycetes bacterium RIFCSPLOWO2_02_FULL_50_16]
MDWPNFGWNVIVEFIGLAIGVPITIFVIDWLIKRREEKRWKGLKLLVKKDILYIATVTITSIRCALHISWRDALQINSLAEVSAEEKNRRVTQFGERFARNFEDTYKERLLRMAPSDWNTLRRNFAEFHNGINSTFSMYAGYLEPELAQHLILVRNKTFSILTLYRTFPEAFNDTLENIQHDTALMETREAAVNDIRELIINVLKLRSSVEKL